MTSPGRARLGLVEALGADAVAIGKPGPETSPTSVRQWCFVAPLAATGPVDTVKRRGSGRAQTMRLEGQEGRT